MNLNIHGIRKYETLSINVKQHSIFTSKASIQQADVQTENKNNIKTTDIPLLLKSVRGLPTERTPVWLMRQAGRYQKAYQDLCKKHTTFRERSENADIAAEVSLQPYHSFKPDGVILFSDILTPLTGMNIPFDIVKGQGPIIHDPILSMEQVQKVRILDPTEDLAYVGKTLNYLKSEIDSQTTLLGFVGAPFTLAVYSVEGGSSKTFSKIKSMMFSQPQILHAFLQKLTESITIYTRYQADNGAQVIQLFDTWAAELAPQDFDTFCLPYIQKIVSEVKRTHPDLPLIFYTNGSGGLLERIANTGVDIISVDQYSSLSQAIDRTQNKFAYQGNIDPAILFGNHESIKQRIQSTLLEAKNKNARHILNLGHGIMVGTQEDNVRYFFETAKSIKV